MAVSCYGRQNMRACASKSFSMSDNANRTVYWLNAVALSALWIVRWVADRSSSRFIDTSYNIISIQPFKHWNIQKFKLFKQAKRVDESMDSLANWLTCSSTLLYSTLAFVIPNSNCINKILFKIKNPWNIKTKTKSNEQTNSSPSPRWWSSLNFNWKL